MRRSLLSILLCVLFSVPAFHAARADQIYMDLTFDDQPVDEPLGNGGTAIGQTSYADPAVELTVRSTPFPTPCLEVHNTNLALPRNCGFFLPGGVVTSGLVVVDIDFWLQQAGTGWQWTYSFSNSDWQALAEVTMQTDGTIRVTDFAGSLGSLGSAPLGQPVSLRMAFDLGEAVYSVWLDGVEKVTDSPLTNSALNFYRVGVLTGWNSDPDNVFWIDRIRVQDTLDEVPVKRTSWGGVKALYGS